MGDNTDETDKAVILGAGLSGLTAAYHLKRNKFPFRLFEGSSRVGGRILTVRDVNVSSQNGELGAERIEMDHAAVQALAKELNISLAEYSLRESAGWFGGGKMLPAGEWNRESAELARIFQQVQREIYGVSAQILNSQNKDQYPKAVLLDQMSAAELLSRLQTQMKPWMKPFLEQVVRSEWGVEPAQISSLHLVHWMRDSFRPSGRKFYKLKGGASILTQALLDRVSGVVPDRFVRFRHQLIEIKKSENIFILTFRTPTGNLEVKSRKVICTLPPTQLRAVSGWERLFDSPEKVKQYAGRDLGTHAKVLLSFKDRYWTDSSLIGSGAPLYTDLPSTLISEAGDPVKSGLNASHGLLQSQIGGEAGARAGLHSVQQMLKDLSQIDRKASDSYENINYVQNWKTFPWSKGSRPYLKPGQFQTFDISPPENDWLMAGDSQSLAFHGTMNGSVVTALEAADRFIKTRA